MVAECDTFQCHKGEMKLLPGLLEPFPIPTRIWTYISMDFIDGLLKSGGKTIILVVVDRLSKYSHFCALIHPYTASLVAQIFMDQIFRLHGIPSSIVSDRDATFTSHFWTKLFHHTGTKLNINSGYHPQHMVRLKSSTNFWKLIFVVSPMNNNIIGKSGSLSLNGGTILLPYFI